MKNIKLTYSKILLAIFMIISSININFVSFDYIIGVMLKNIVEIGIIALPVTLIIATGGIDLAVGSTMILSSIIGGIFAVTFGGSIGLIACLATATLCEFINGLIIAYLKISPLVTTLATMYLYLGIARGISKGNSIYSFGIANFLGNCTIFGIPIQIYIYILFAIIFTIIMSKSILGRLVLAIGNNENATIFSGINTNKIKILIYTLSGVMCSIAALTWLGRFSSVKYDVGIGINLKVVTVIVLGGTSILGGNGDMKGTIIATLIIALLNSGLTVLNIALDTQTIINGGILAISLIAFSIINNKSKQRKFISSSY